MQDNDVRFTKSEWKTHTHALNKDHENCQSFYSSCIQNHISG